MSTRFRGSTSLSQSSANRAYWIVIPLTASLFVYRKLVNVYFNSDDFLNLFFIVDRPTWEYILRPHGGHVLFARNAVFWLSFQLFGVWPEFYQATVLLTHLLNVALLYVLVWRLTANGIVSALVAALWGVYPVHAGTIGWYSVYGQVLVATIVLALLNQAVRATVDHTALPWRTLITWPLLLLIASTCFGVGIGVAIVAPVVLFFLSPPGRRRSVVCGVLLVVAFSLSYLYDAALWLHRWYTSVSPDGLAAGIAFLQRSVQPHQVLMVAYLFAYGAGTLLIGFFSELNKFPQSAWVMVALFACLVALVFIRGSAQARRALLAFTVLAAGCYGIIALGRAQFFRTEQMAAGAAQARYHYAATVPFAAMLGIVLAQIIEWFHLRARAQIALLLLWLAVAGWSYRTSAPFLDPFPNARQETRMVIRSVTQKVKQAGQTREVVIRNQPFRTIGMLYLSNPMAFPGWAAIYTIFFPTNRVDGKQVRFLEQNPRVVAAAKRGRRTADLIISPEDLRPCEYP